MSKKDDKKGGKKSGKKPTLTEDIKTASQTLQDLLEGNNPVGTEALYT